MVGFKLGRRHFLSLVSALLSATALAPLQSLGQTEAAKNLTLSKEMTAKILAQGVPAEAFLRLMDFRTQFMGKSFQQETYTCSDKEPGSLRPCEENKRSRSSTEVTVTDHPYLVIIDYRQSSLSERMYIIHLPTGDVTKMMVTHGKNSGDLYAYKFSNIKDSRQTSLGIYLVGKTYYGGYGQTLRMYGLQGSNDQAYNRDIVMHGADYAAKDFPKRENYKTKKPYGRLGVSWGCPAVAMANAKKWFPRLKEGALIYHYQPELEEAAQTGREVIGPNLELQITPEE